ncbi:MAG: hypothetical protein H6R26_854 [Proteobacteria bacterium]|nr:hypothetical protein [Pseudomonadota bacterium]
MTTQADPPELSGEAEQTELSRLLVDGLTPIVPAPPQQEKLRANLMERVARSVAAHAGLLTVRHKDGVWQTLKTGIRFKHLWSGPVGSSVLIEFAPGAALPAHRHHWLEEGIVLRGGLQMGDLDLGPLDYHVSPPGSRHGGIRSRQGALAYLRGTSLGDKPSVLHELLAGMLPLGRDASRTVYAAQEDGWVEVADGVMQKRLWSDGAMVSRFCRLEPGARVPGHGHKLDEECMMLQGELFLGDILLREGEYQLAPAGSRHGEIYTDVGAIFFVRSVLDD